MKGEISVELVKRLQKEKQQEEIRWARLQKKLRQRLGFADAGVKFTAGYQGGKYFGT